MSAARTHATAPKPVTREMLLASWHGAQRIVATQGVIQLNAASYAGLLLERTGGHVPSAYHLIPEDAHGSFYERVREYLDAAERGR